MKQTMDEYYFDGYNENDKILFNFPGFHSNTKKSNFKQFNSYFKQEKKNIYTPISITLFHGSSLGNFKDIIEQGILPTTANNRNSYQSSSGYVYVTPFLYLAQRFGSYAASWRQHQECKSDLANSITYKLELEITKLNPDKDQINNFNNNNFEDKKLTYNYAESIICGKSLCHKGKVFLNSIKSIILYDIENNKNIEIDFNLSDKEKIFEKIEEVRNKNLSYEKTLKKVNDFSPLI